MIAAGAALGTLIVAGAFLAGRQAGGATGAGDAPPRVRWAAARRRLVEFASAAGLAGATVVVPWALVHLVGWPLPDDVPDGDWLSSAARHPEVAGDALVSCLAVVVWLAWFQLMWALAWEVGVNVPRRRRGELDVTAPGTARVLGRLARGLLTPLVLAVGVVPSATVRASGAEPAEHEVVAGDTLWDIAAERLGDPLRWREVFELNQGRQFDDGRTLVDPGLIHPGWRLVLPPDDEPGGAPDADPPAGSSAVAPVDDPPAVPVPAPVDEAAPAPSRPPVPDTEPVAPVTTAPQEVAPVTSTAPEEVAPSTRVPEVGSAPESPADRRPVNRWLGPGEAPATLPPPGTPAAHSLGGPVVRAEAGLVTMDRAAMMSAGVLLLLGARRRQRLRSGHALDPVPPPAAAVERAVRAIRPSERFARVDLAVRAAARQLARDGHRPLAVLVAPDGTVDLRTTGPARLGAPWTGGGACWTIPATVSLEQLAEGARGVAAPTPLLVQLGCDGARDVYVDLEAVGALRIDADARTADAVVAAIATTLATSVLAEVATLIGVGVPVAAFCGHRHHVAAADLPGALSAAVDSVGATVTAGRSTFELRALGTGGDTWAPAIVLVGSDRPAADVPFVPTGVALVSAAPFAGPCSVLAPRGDAWLLQPAGIRVEPIGLTPPHVAALADLLGPPAPAAPVGAAAGVADRDASPSTERVPADPVVVGRELLDPLPIAAVPAAGAQPTGSLSMSPAPCAGLDGSPSTVPVPADSAAVGCELLEPLAAAPPPAVCAQPGGAPSTPPAPAPLAEPVAVRCDLRNTTTMTDTSQYTTRPVSRPGPPEGAPAHAFLVRLMGRVRVETAAGDVVAFERSKALELVAWLATHRTRATRRLARTAMWEVDVRHATFANVVSDARRALARAVPPAHGEEWVGRTMTDELPLHPLVRTDAELLSAALDAARGAPAAAAIAVLRPVVDLLGGTPFEGSDYLWPDAEGITSSLVVLSTRAATELGERCLAVGDPAGVFAATDRGLRVLPGHEELIGLRMRAHARVGDRAGVRHEFEAYTRSLLVDPWSDGEPSPKLVRLRAELLGG